MRRSVENSPPQTPALLEARHAARLADLIYVNTDDPGIERRRCGRGFCYLTGDGKPVRNARTLRRIAALAIPPAWTTVWICANEGGHLQATGRDARGRRQYRYHAAWRRVRDTTKFERLAQFAAALPTLRRQVREAMRLPGLPRDKVLATAVHLLDVAGVRIGNEAYRVANGSFGLTTLHNRHVRVRGSQLSLQFPGKAGQRQRIELGTPRLVRIVRRCSELPGQRLFQYVDENGMIRALGSAEVNAAIQAWMGNDFTAKDFRTWVGSVSFATAAMKSDKTTLGALLEHVSNVLGNTPAICRKHYIHPSLIEHFLEGQLRDRLRTAPAGPRGLQAAERVLLRFLQSQTVVTMARTTRRPARTVAARVRK
jgi:DNA topoisomerase-1